MVSKNEYYLVVRFEKRHNYLNLALRKIETGGTKLRSAPLLAIPANNIPSVEMLKLGKIKYSTPKVNPKPIPATSFPLEPPIFPIGELRFPAKAAKSIPRL